jgi:hypothetical protein
LPYALFNLAAYGMALGAVAWHLRAWPPWPLVGVFVALALAHARWLGEVRGSADGNEAECQEN